MAIEDLNAKQLGDQSELSYPDWFSARCRDGKNHWDIGDERGRTFRIRGEAGNLCVIDEREPNLPIVNGFPTVDSAMAYVISKTLREPIENTKD